MKKKAENSEPERIRILLKRGEVDSKKHRLERDRKFMQGILDQWKALDLGMIDYDSFLRMIRDPYKFVQDLLILRDWKPESMGIKLDESKIRDLMQMPDLSALHGSIHLLFRMASPAQVHADHREYFDIANGRIVFANIDKLEDSLSIWATTPGEIQRLEYVSRLAETFKAMHDSKLWPDAWFQGGTSKFTTGLEINPNAVKLTRDISASIAWIEAEKNRVWRSNNDPYNYRESIPKEPENIVHP